MAAHNEKLRAARETTPSRWFPGRAMTRTELAHLVVEHVWTHEGIEAPLDRKYIAKLETGVIRHPTARYRRALRAVLGVGSDLELGFVSANTRQAAGRLAGAGDDPHGLVALADLLRGRPPPDPHTAALIDGLWREGPAPPVDLVDPGDPAAALLPDIVDRARDLTHLDRALAARDHGAGPVDTTATADRARVAARVGVTGRHLLVAVAELCQLAGLAAGDAGDAARARRYLSAGTRAAHAGADRAFADHLAWLQMSDIGAVARTDRPCAPSVVRPALTADEVDEIVPWATTVMARARHAARATCPGPHASHDLAVAGLPAPPPPPAA